MVSTTYNYMGHLWELVWPLLMLTFLWAILEERLLNRIDDKPDIWWRFSDDTCMFTVSSFGEGCIDGFQTKSIIFTIPSSLQLNGWTVSGNSWTSEFS